MFCLFPLSLVDSAMGQLRVSMKDEKHGCVFFHGINRVQMPDSSQEAMH
jgi:hypothetical protein